MPSAFPPAFAVAVTLFLAGGCAPQTGPDRLLAGYLQALADGKTADAWALVAPNGRTLPAAEFERLALAVRPALTPLPRVSGPVRSLAEWRAAAGTLTLVREGPTWRIESGISALYPRDTPTAALATFVAAFRRERYDILLALAPPDERLGLTEDQLQDYFRAPDVRGELEVRLAFLVPQLGSAVPEIDGDSATLRYGPYLAVLHRYEDGWTVVDL